MTDLSARSQLRSAIKFRISWSDDAATTCTGRASQPCAHDARQNHVRVHVQTNARPCANKCASMCKQMRVHVQTNARPCANKCASMCKQMRVHVQTNARHNYVHMCANKVDMRLKSPASSKAREELPSDEGCMTHVLHARCMCCTHGPQSTPLDLSTSNSWRHLGWSHLGWASSEWGLARM